MDEFDESSIESILNEIGVKNPDFTSLEAALVKAKHDLVEAQLIVDNAQMVLDEAKEKPNIRELIKVKIEGMLQLDFEQQAIVDALKMQYCKNKKSVYKKECVALDDKVKKEIIEYILNITDNFKTVDIWEKFSNYKRSDVYSNVIAPLVKEKKIVKRGEKRGVYYCVADLV